MYYSIRLSKLRLFSFDVVWEIDQGNKSGRRSMYNHIKSSVHKVQ